MLIWPSGCTDACCSSSSLACFLTVIFWDICAQLNLIDLLYFKIFDLNKNRERFLFHSIEDRRWDYRGRFHAFSTGHLLVLQSFRSYLIFKTRKFPCLPQEETTADNHGGTPRASNFTLWDKNQYQLVSLFWQCKKKKALMVLLKAEWSFKLVWALTGILPPLCSDLEKTSHNQMKWPMTHPHSRRYGCFPNFILTKSALSFWRILRFKW